MNSGTGKWIMVAGVILLLVGAVVYFMHDRLNWVGRLPGDVRIEKGNFRFYFPVTTMIIFSLLLTIILTVIRKLL